MVRLKEGFPNIFPIQLKDFNSNMVRLKVEAYSIKNALEVNFNSNMVRLKERI